MKKLTAIAALGAASLGLAACGSSDDASSDLDPESVEVAADEALEGVTDEPPADAGANLDQVELPAAVSTETATEAADRAESVAAEAQAAAEAAEAAEAAANINIDE